MDFLNLSRAVHPLHRQVQIAFAVFERICGARIFLLWVRFDYFTCGHIHSLMVIQYPFMRSISN